MADLSPAADSRSHYERMLAGDLYIADDPEIGRRHQHAVGLADAYHRACIAGDEGARSILDEPRGQPR
ncbi:hypothetical protein GCM10025876_07020 [Demequina litorisediminis]|uniref:Maltose/galactoside acetyltransferase domain-containing protein n=1 Tax=Demequina litorisediminis TaxID=1849022 RepID=A0ABQ6IBL7_9MICO|nr:hypothetical protein GCM10025876_07020 [Demequina litorisediminis]